MRRLEPELLRLGADGRDPLGARLALGARDGADGRDTCGRDGADGRRFADGLGVERVGAEGRRVADGLGVERLGVDGRADGLGAERDGAEGLRVADGLGVERLGVDGRADGLEDRDGVVRRSRVGVVRRAGAVLDVDERFGSTLRVGADCRLVVSGRLGVTRLAVGSVCRWGVASRCGVASRAGTTRRLDTSAGRAASGVPRLGVASRRPAFDWLCGSAPVGRSAGVMVRRPSVMPQPDGWTRRPVSVRVAWAGVRLPASAGVATLRRPAVLAVVGETCRPVARSAVGLTRRPAVLTTAGALRRPPCSVAYRAPRSEYSRLPLDGAVRRRVSMPPRAMSYRPLSFQAYRPRYVVPLGLRG